MGTTVDLEEFVERLLQELAYKVVNAAKRGKPTMWSYYRKIHDHVVETYGNLHDKDEILIAASGVEQQARQICLVSSSQRLETMFIDADYSDMAIWYAYSVYARKIMRHAGYPVKGWVSKWLR